MTLRNRGYFDEPVALTNMIFIIHDLHMASPLLGCRTPPSSLVRRVVPNYQPKTELHAVPNEPLSSIGAQHFDCAQLPSDN
jgi:hypothetical protein